MKRFVTTFIGAIILFVVVCPITPTPIAVPGAKTAHIHVPFAPVALLAFAVSISVQHSVTAGVDNAPALPADSLVDLNCTRLC